MKSELTSMALRHHQDTILNELNWTHVRLRSSHFSFIDQEDIEYRDIVRESNLNRDPSDGVNSKSESQNHRT